MFVMKGSIAYEHPTDDPVFAAHRPRTKLDFATGGNQTLYLPDSILSPVGCAQQVVTS